MADPRAMTDAEIQARAALKQSVVRAHAAVKRVSHEARRALIRTQGWRERIVAARQHRGQFTREDRMLACEWMTCAVGEQHLKTPEVYLLDRDCSLPRDLRLIRLGALDGGFTGCIFANDVDGAERHLDAIEDRVLELKRESGIDSATKAT